MEKKLTLGFDIYGTIIDVHEVTQLLFRRIGERAALFSQRWREKQLEYSFRRGLMRNYVDFSVCTSQALEWTDRIMNTDLHSQFKKKLMEAYGSLPAFPDAAPAIREAGLRGFRVFAFTNGPLAVMGPLLEQAGLRSMFIDLVSVDEIKSFKPDPAAYAHFLRRTSAHHTQTWLISGNPFDVTGALSAGMRAAWVRRDARSVFDPWELQPDLIVASLDQLVDGIASQV
jgi:2-haloacid dehalogenase